MKNLIRFLIVSFCAFIAFSSINAQAASFGTFDPRSLAMGGTGVSAAQITNAGYYNPALLSLAEEDEDFSLIVPTVGVRAYDPNELLDSFDAYQNGEYETTFNNAVSNFNAADAGGKITLAPSVLSSTQQLLNGLNSLSNKGLDFEFHGGFNLSIPSKTLGMAVHGNVRAMGGLNIDISAADQNTIQRYIDVLDYIVNGTPITLADYADIYNGTNLTTPSGLSSAAQIRGAAISEIALSIATEFDFFDGISVGITPKAVTVSTFDQVVNIETADQDSEANTKEYQDVNLDVGIAKKFGESWKTGLVVKNIISKEYKTVLGNIIEIKPQARVGVSHHTNWTTIAVDLDLTESDTVGLSGQKTQFAAIGMELDLALLQVRAGYRHNLSAEGEEEAGVVSAGIGLYFGFHLDIGAAVSEDEVEAGIQLGFQF